MLYNFTVGHSEAPATASNAAMFGSGDAWIPLHQNTCWHSPKHELQN